MARSSPSLEGLVACQAGTGRLGSPERRSLEAVAVPFIAPSEIQNTKLSAALRGYDREETDTLLTQIKASYERVWEEREELRAEVMRLQAQARENGQLRAELERIEPELEELKGIDQLLRDTLVSAERTTEKLKQDALAEAELTVTRARKRADELNMKTETDRDRLEQELEELEETTRQVRERCREFLVQALEAIERSDSLTALDSEQQELPAPLGHLNDA